MENKFKLLIVEDEEAILRGLIDLFVYHGYEVDSAKDGKEGLARAKSGGYDLIILDVMLPSLDGFSICNEIRKTSKEQPIIMLTAKTSEEDIITGLTLGADDYVAKPFSVRELVLRVESVLRRTKKAKQLQAAITIGESWEIDSQNLTAKRIKGKGAAEIELTRREVEILQFLKENSFRPVSREELLEEVWGYSRASSIETRTVDIHIAKLRRKIEENARDPKIVLTIRGEGYRLMS
jgi:DNA-binding response OmpR family regulator